VRKREREFWQELLTRTQSAHEQERAGWAAERRQLLERIQRPEYRPVEPGPKVAHDPPSDAQELAYVGQEVPEFVNVGTPGAPTDAPITDLVDLRKG
jgi:hypothetical protein